MFGERAREYGTHFAFVNLVGGQDELVFDGQSLLLGPDGSVLARASQFEEELLVAEVPGAPGAPAPLADPLPELDEVYAALVLGLRDYVGKNRFGHVGLGISGGIDLGPGWRCSRSTRSGPRGDAGRHALAALERRTRRTRARSPAISAPS